MEDNRRKREKTDIDKCLRNTYIRVTEVKKEKGKETELVKWLKFIQDPESKEVKKYMKENKEIKEAGEKLKVISEDEKMQRIAELKQKAIMDRNAEIDFATEKGIDIGQKEKTKEIAKKMKEEGIEIQVIQKVTGLTEKEIKEL